MKLTFGRVSVIVLSAAMGVALWRYWENAQALDALRAESSDLRTELNGPAGSRGFQAIVAPDPKASGESSTGRSRTDDAALAEFAKLSPEEQTAFLRRWKQEMTARRAAVEAAKVREEAAKANAETAEALAKRNKGPQAAYYAGGKATGPPDAGDHGGDSANTWCAAPQSDANQWLKLSYGKPVEIAEIAIHENYSTGALSRVVAVMPDGKEKVIWQGTEPVEPPPVQRIVQVPKGVRSDQIRIELDTTRTQNWQEIDAVEMVGRDGSRQWAKEAEGSSYWGSGNSYGQR